MVVPARDAHDTLPAALASVLAQDYGAPLEVVVADGSATPATADLVRRLFPEVRVVPNPGGGTSAGLNRALAASRHPVVARCDAHAVLPPGYLARAVATLARTGAVNVGGRQRAAGTTPFGRAVALAMGSRLGSGGARYRIGGPAGPVDTVYLGVYRRAALEAAGGFDETLARNQDYELNWRLRRRGGTVWFDPALAVDYRPRAGVRALARQYFDYGRWKRAVLARHPRSLRPRQLAAPLLLAALAASVALAATGWAGTAGALAPALAPRAGPLLLAVAAACPAGYAALLAGAAAAAGLRRRPGAALLPLALATMHLAWGAGFVAGGAGRRGGGRRSGDGARW